MTIINSNIAENIHTHAKIVQQNTQTEQKRQKSLKKNSTKSYKLYKIVRKIKYNT